MGTRASYYNEIDTNAADWLRWLISQDLIPAGDVDTRSIADVQPEDLNGYAQCHFFAGIGGWGYAARLAGWPDDQQLWTGSCPCQPFSVARKGLGTDDPRHLWPYYLRLIRARRPAVVMGEQVAGAAGYGWLDGVLADLAGEDYAGRGIDLPACAVDAPHIRQRLYWVAVDVADADRARLEVGTRLRSDAGAERATAERGDAGDVGHTGSSTSGGHTGGFSSPQARERCAGELSWGEPNGSRPSEGRSGTFWSDAEWIPCHDGKARRTQPGTPLLAHGVPGRVAKWRGLGNAIVPQLAAEVIAALKESL